mmetsp:Transcript_99877/g.149626  ORF Transcript_99877/g.149626 Transcript_99877/m.149626 type:complete len:268 (+) Transcript_99877:90-893(+)
MANNDNDEEKGQSSPTSQTQIMNLDGHHLPMAGVVVSSVIFLIAVTSQGGPGKGSGYRVYGIVLAVIAMICALMSLGLSKKPDLVESNPDIPRYLNYFLFSWNFVGACMMTFGGGPFVVTSNGYFSVWAMAIFAVYGIGVAFWDTARNAGSMMAHLAASILVIIALASGNGSFKFYKGESMYGIIVASISAALMLFQMHAERAGSGHSLEGKSWFAVMVIMAILWIVAAGLMTFRGPFVNTSNGYFGSWGGAITAVLIAMALKPSEF